ncbi:MAG: hypothetical protein HZB19_12980 [Chloroflexi bacterium]|nr:hypothetical protein [Chloroflexota bacterium]
MRVLTAVIAIAFGLLVLAGYFIPALHEWQTLLLNWAMILAAAAAIVGVFNLISVHGEKIRQREKGNLYSALLIISLVSTFLFGLVQYLTQGAVRVLLDDLMSTLVNGIIFPAEAMLMGLLTVTLLYTAIRLLRRRANLMSIVFLITAALILLGTATLPFGDMPVFSGLRTFITQTLAVGGARGILIGVALGTLTTGLRVLLATDRPYGGK